MDYGLWCKTTITSYHPGDNNPLLVAAEMNVRKGHGQRRFRSIERSNMDGDIYFILEMRSSYKPSLDEKFRLSCQASKIVRDNLVGHYELIP